MESGFDDRADARIPLHKEEGKLDKRKGRHSLQSSDPMSFRIDDMEAVLRFEDGFDVWSFDRPTHHPEVDLFRLNEV